MRVILDLLADASAPDPAVVARSVKLFAVVASLLGAFMLMVIAVSLIRTRRLRNGSSRRGGDAADGLAADAWAEAGRRAEPFDASGRREPEE